MADNKVTIEFSVEGDGQTKIDALAKAIKDFGEQGQKSVSGVQRVFETAAGVFTGEAILHAVEKLADSLFSLAKESIAGAIKAAEAQEDAIARLNNALVTTGRYTDSTSESLQKFAEGLQATTKFSDEQVIQAEALIQSLANLDEQGLKRATLGAVNLAAGLKIDLQTAALDVAKAADGIVGPLGRLGLKLDESNTKSENLAQALDFIKKKFGDAANNEVNTFSGALAVLNHQYEEGAKQTGIAIITNQSLVNVIKEAGAVLKEFQEASKENKKAISDFVSEGVIFAIEALDGFVTVAQKAAIGFLRIEQAATAAQAGVQFFVNLVSGAEDLGVGTEQAAQKFQDLENSINKLESGNSIVQKLKDGISRLKDAAEEGLGKTTDEAQKASNAMRNAAGSADELSKAQQKLIDEGAKLIEQAEKKDPNKEYAARKKALDAYHAATEGSEKEYNAAVTEFNAERIQKVSDLEFKKAESIIAQNDALLAADRFGNQQKIQDNNATLQQIAGDADLSAKDRARIEENLVKQQKTLDQERQKSGVDAINALATLQNAKSKELAAVGKAAAIASATIDTYKGASGAASALAGIPYVGPALAAAAAAAFIVAGLARVATIAGVNLAGGGEVPGGFPNDTFRANLTSGENVVDTSTNRDLKGFLAGSQNMIPLLQGILQAITMLQIQTVVNIGNKTIVDEVQRGLQQGRSISL